MMGAVRRLLWLAAGLALLVSCDVKRPKGVLDEAEMEEVLYDYHIAKVMAEEVPYNEAHRRPLYRQGVFAKHGITEAQFDSSMVWYTRHTELLAKMYERITKRLRQANDLVNDLIALRDMPTEGIPSGDSVKVWRLRRHQLLTSVPLNSCLNFELTADTTFHERDSLCFQLDYRYYGLVPDTLEAAVMGLTLHFKNDTILHTWQRLLPMEEGSTALVLQSDTLGALRTVSGFIYLPNSPKATTLRLLSSQVMRYHAKDSLRLDGRAQPTSDQAAPAHPEQLDADSMRSKPSTPPATGQPLRETDRLRQRHTTTAPSTSATPARQEKRNTAVSRKRIPASKQLQPMKLDER